MIQYVVSEENLKKNLEARGCQEEAVKLVVKISDTSNEKSIIGILSAVYEINRQ